MKKLKNSQQADIFAACVYFTDPFVCFQDGNIVYWLEKLKDIFLNVHWCDYFILNWIADFQVFICIFVLFFSYFFVPFFYTEFRISPPFSIF